MKNVLVRSISGIIYVALIVGALLAGSYYTFSLMALFGALGLLELQRAALPHRAGAVSALAKAVDIAALVAIVFLPAAGSWWAAAVWMAVIMPAWFLLRGLLALYDKAEHPFRAAAWSAMSMVYLAMPLLTLSLLYTVRGGATLVLVMFVMIWLNDTGAFCAGSLMGRHKMFPRLSPKKTWEGFAGGFIFCVAAGWVCAVCFNAVAWAPAVWIIFGILTSIFATWGDLFESLLKRNAGVKDSGNLIPGHGGILDRIDSLLFVAPASFLYYLIITII